MSRPVRETVTKGHSEYSIGRPRDETRITHLALRVSFWPIGAYSGVRTSGEPRRRHARLVDETRLKGEARVRDELRAQATRRSCATI
jgi:hypothetical protein